jgi:hypothetical protein
VVVLFKLSELLEIPEHPVSETGASGFAELGSAEQALAVCIGCKPEHPV